MVKILVIGDLHGRMPRFHFKEFDYIICVGDICDDRGLRPFYKKYFALIKKFGVDDAPDFDVFMEQKFGEGKYREIMDESIVVGRKILRKLDSFGVPVFFVPGNWDYSYGPTRVKDMDKDDYNYLRTWIDWWLGRRTNKKLLRGFRNVYDLQYGLYRGEEFNVLGYGNISGPEKLKEKIREYEMSNRERVVLKKLAGEIPGRLNRLFSKRNKKVPTIFVSHNIPYGVMDKGGDRKSHVYGKHLGSTVARDFCLKKKPEICLGGHVHEFYGKRKLGDTVVVNVGHGRDAQVLLDINERTGKVKVEFVPKVVEKYRESKV